MMKTRVEALETTTAKEGPAVRLFEGLAGHGAGRVCSNSAPSSRTARRLAAELDVRCANSTTGRPGPAAAAADASGRRRVARPDVA